MPENKKQHYVPQFYIRNFSKDKKRVFIYHLESKQVFLSPINSTCQDKYFYGLAPDFEKLLAEFEQKQAAVIKKIIETRNLNMLTHGERFDLYGFVMLQFTRTKDARMVAENYVEFFVKNYLKPLIRGRDEFKEYSSEYIDSLKITMPQFYMYSMGLALNGIEGILDLKPLLLVNKTKCPFISSDAPVVKNNYFRIKNDSLTGFQSPGLQIVCPLNESLLLVLLHEDAYKIIGECNSIIEVTDESDVESLNKLQILNALEILFINSNEEEKIRQMDLSNLPIKIKKQFSEKTVKTTQTPDGGHSDIVCIQSEGINYGIHFSFLKMDHQYNRRFKGRCKQILKKSPVVQPYRSRELIDRMQYRFDQFTGKVGPQKSRNYDSR